MLSSVASLSFLIWSRYLAGVLMAWLLLVSKAGLDDASLCFVVALGLGWPLSALLMIVEPYLEPHFEAWIEGDRARIEKLWRCLSQWRADEPREEKGPRPGSIGARLPD